jgi:hypothetical protein
VEPSVEDQENEAVDDEAHDDVQHSPPVLQSEDDLPIAIRKSKRGCGRPRRLIEECNMTYYALSCAEQVDSSYEPTRYTEATACGDREKWIAAMQEDMQSLEKNCTWDVVPLPKGKKHVRCKWIYKRKEMSVPNNRLSPVSLQYNGVLHFLPYHTSKGAILD